MRINSIGVMPQNNITTSQTNKNVAFKGFKSSLSVEEFEQAAQALKGKKGFALITDEVVTKSTERFKELTAKLKEAFEHSIVDLYLFKEGRTLWASLLPSKEATGGMPKGLAIMKNNFMFAEHGKFLADITAAAEEMKNELSK